MAGRKLDLHDAVRNFLWSRLDITSTEFLAKLNQADCAVLLEAFKRSMVHGVRLAAAREDIEEDYRTQIVDDLLSKIEELENARCPL